MNKDIILLGIQWCGKWTQADLLMKALPDCLYYEMWQVLRSFHSNDNLIWNYMKTLMNRWDMVDHFITYWLIDITLQIADKEKKGLIIDGFPRAMEQAAFFVKAEDDYGRDFVIINYKLSKEKALERMIKRAWIEARADDTPEAMQKRIDLFEQNTLPVLEFFEKQGKLITINADDTIENIFNETMSKLNSL